MSTDRAEPCPRLPPLLARTGALFPLAVLRPPLEYLLNRVFDDAIRDGALDLLAARELALRIDDLGLAIGFRLLGNRLVVTTPRAPDAVIHGPFAAFAWLAARVADADSLFFHRQLALEGDTELGLSIRNAIDALDPTSLPALLQGVLAAIVRAVPAQPPGAIAVMPGSPYQ